jgi:hypothetical protein
LSRFSGVTGGVEKGGGNRKFRIDFLGCLVRNREGRK